jgi:N-acyl-D-amino-acid deacylase
VRDVFVNGTAALRDGEATKARPGQVVRGPGWTGWPGGGACKSRK